MNKNLGQKRFSSVRNHEAAKSPWQPTSYRVWTIVSGVTILLYSIVKNPIQRSVVRGAYAREK